MGVFFDGKSILKPGAYSRVDASGMLSAGVSSGKTPLFIGSSDDGLPQQIMYFASPADAKAVLSGGDLLRALEIAWSPSTSVPGAGVVACIRVNNATQATHTFADAVKITALGYNTKDYEFKVVVDDGDVYITLTDGTITEIIEAENTSAAIVAAINENSQLVVAETTGTGLGVLTASVGFVAFATAGTSPAATSSDWENCIDKAEFADIQALIPVTADETVHAYVKDHVLRLSDVVNRKERRMFVGHASNETIDQILTRVVNLGTHRALLASPGIKKVVNGVVVDLSPVFTACALAGMWAGTPHEHPLTYDYINCLGLTKIYTNAEINMLIKGGVTVVESVPGKGYRVVLATTTYLMDGNIMFKELSVSTLVDIMSRELREFLEAKFIGKVDTTVLTSAKNATETKLNAFVREGWLVEGADQNTGEVLPPFRNIEVRKVGTALYINWEGSPITPNNYVLITSYFTL